VTDMLTADKLMVALIGGRGRAVPDETDANAARARSRERIVLVHRTLARRRQRVIAARRLP
jgi:flagellar biosynthesis/type III secretory pathway ATPase